MSFQHQINRAPTLRTFGVLTMIGALMLGLAACGGKKKSESEAYREQPIDRGQIVRAVSATGALQPLISITVGSTVSGPVRDVMVDFNSQVKAGDILAIIDPTSFEARVAQLTAELDSQRANLNVQRAGLVQAEADYANAAADYKRYQTLGAAGFASESLLLQKKTLADRAAAAVRLAEAQVTSQLARVRNAEAALASARFDLSRTIIRAPVTGVVVDRKVDPGQSVAANFQAPTLFVIAQDLSKLQAAISVDEADIGDVAAGQAVRFSVDAFPGEEFKGLVSQVRKQGNSNQGVVSYTVIVEAANAGGALLPGMTANAEIVIEEKADVLRLPNAALRFKPADPDALAEAERLPPLPGAAAGAPAAPVAAGPPAGAGGGNGGRMGERLAEALSLTPAQKTAFDAAMSSARAAAGERPGPDAEPGARRAYFRKIMEKATRQITPLLTEPQKAKLTAFLKEQASGKPARVRDAVVWVLRAKKPVPVRLRLGLADENNTEILTGELKAGDKLIVGGGPKPKGKGPQGGFGGGPPVRM